ncbi:hypothetical protein RN001_014437 [Aquatica leii]|uniref:Uncharacterized protein n=1 Tax=Aquatica leii TaxID=1421715 RepID=A0AAN7P0L3_9COLE|nr:hypothetical protein RN001_014437 [Aquatica leii]
MDSINEIMRLCRLCLAKDEVNTPIFEEHGDIKQILLKISACLPVKVSKEDNLPKNICDGCSCKLEMLYHFWSTSANSEKKLIKLLDQIGVNKLSDNNELPMPSSLQSQQHSISSDPVVLKQEVVDVIDSQSVEEDLVHEDLIVTNDQDYLLEQEQIPYQPVEFQFQQDGFETVTAEDESTNVDTKPESESKPRKRRAAAMKALATMESEDEDDPDLIDTKIAKTEEQSDESAGEDPEPTTFVGLPSADDEQPGPSGVGKPSSDAPAKMRARVGSRYSGIVKLEGRNSFNNAVTKKRFLKCSVCSARFQSADELEEHRLEDHPALGKRRRKAKTSRVEDVFIKEEVIEEELNLIFSTDDEEDELEVVFNEGFTGTQQIVDEQLKSLQVEGCCLLCNNGKVMPAEQLKKHYKKHERILTHFKEEKSDNRVVNVFYCHICKDGIVMTKKELKDHYLSDHDTRIPDNGAFYKKAIRKRPRSPRPEVFRCEICNEEFSTKVLLEEHFDRHDDQYSCDICNTGFKKLIDYTFHMQGHSEDKMFKCPLCEFSTDKGYLVKSHLYSVHDRFKKYKCELCGKGFAIFTHFQEHRYFHTGEKPFQCSECGQKFMYTRYLNSHKVQMHKKEQKGIACAICSKVYSHRNSLNTHMKSHTGAMSVCDVCGKTLSSNEKLRLHYRIHTGEKPYKCDYCQKSFKTSSYRAEHERTHTGEKPYECPFCGKGFSQRTSMVIHSRGHTGEKPYFCHLCKKAFAAKSMVTIHLKSCKGLIGHVVVND